MNRSVFTTQGKNTYDEGKAVVVVKYQVLDNSCAASSVIDDVKVLKTAE